MTLSSVLLYVLIILHDITLPCLDPRNLLKWIRFEWTESQRLVFDETGPGPALFSCDRSFPVRIYRIRSSC